MSSESRVGVINNVIVVVEDDDSDQAGIGLLFYVDGIEKVAIIPCQIFDASAAETFKRHLKEQKLKEQRGDEK